MSDLGRIVDEAFEAFEVVVVVVVGFGGAAGSKTGDDPIGGSFAAVAFGWSELDEPLSSSRTARIC